MTAVAVVSAVKERLAYLISDEAALGDHLKSWKDEVELLKSKLLIIENFLKNSNTNTGSNRDLEKQALQLAYDVEDTVESIALTEDASSSSRKHHRGSSSSRRLIKSIFNLSSTKSHEDDIQTLKGRIDKLINVLSEADKGTATAANTWNANINDSILINSQVNHVVVGMDDDFEKLRWLLLNNDERFPSAVITISGVGGIGKTTLARKLFDDQSVVMQFDCRAWATVGQEFQARDIIGTILVNLSSSESTKEEIEKMETTQLMERLYKVQSGRRCLVVLDDVWSAEAWDTIQFAFPLDHGTKILITTRLTAVGQYVNGCIHQMKLLNDDKSWELFKIQAGTPDLETDEEIAKEIVGHCQGLPLAITVVGGMLRGRKPEDWDEALHRLREFKVNDLEVHKILSLSYNQLPFELKPCFLYLGLFPSDQVISVEKLCLLWMAEGLISTSDLGNKKRMDRAENYLFALVQRGLVLVEKDDVSSHTRNKSCKLHDLIHDLCILIGKREGFSGDFDLRREKMLPLMRRSAIYIDTYNASLNISDPKHIRSLLFFETGGSTWPREFTDLKEFQLARVLDFDRVDFKYKKLPKSTEKLFYLRYLSFRGCDLEELPSSLTNFHFLETLDLCVRPSCKMIIHANIFKYMSSLRHLYFPIAFESATNQKLRLNCLRKLEILVNFHAGLCDANDLPMLENLQIIEGIVDGNNADLKTMIGFIQGNERLCHSSLTIKNYDSYSQERLLIVTSLLKCDVLHHLDIEGHLGSLPSHEGFGSTFTEIVFNGSEFSEDPMPTLGKLPNLTRLVLCNDAYVGKKMCTNAESFPKLRFLKLANLRPLEAWEVEFEAMPLLSSLTVEHCNKLRMFPSDLMDIPTLEEVKIGPMLKEFLEHVGKMIEEQRDLGNDILCVTFYE